MKLPIITAIIFTAISTISYAAEVPAHAQPASTEATKTLTTEALKGTALGAEAKKSNALETTNSMANQTDRISYSLGYDIGHSFKTQNVQLSISAMADGMKDGYMGNKSTMTPQEMQETLLNFQNMLISKRQAEMLQMSDINSKEGEAFLAANKQKPGVVTLPDGLQYKILKAGEGKSPMDNDMVTVNYSGSFVNGKVFDSSYTRGKPSTFPVSQVIPGWTEALKMMKPGAVWEIYVPPALAYGDHSVGPIGPNQTLIFKIELIAVNAGKNIEPAKGSAATQEHKK